jgi:Domain of unknown function (DUF4148)
MKYSLFALALVTGVTCASAFAQSAPATQQPAQNTATVASNGASAAGQSWASTYGETTAPKTRAQVYNELVQAERDGEMQYLDSTVYAGN